MLFFAEKKQRALLSYVRVYMCSAHIVAMFSLRSTDKGVM